MPQAGDLRHRIAFEQRERIKDGAGNWQDEFAERFQRRAAFVYAGGGEAVMAARLEGRGILKVHVRSCSLTRTIRQDWRIRDVHTGTLYAIKEIDIETDRQWVYLVVERGVPA